jgi:hypothetical protein
VRGVLVSLVVLSVLILTGCNSGAPAPSPATSSSPDSAPPTERVVGPITEADSKALATMNDRLKEYLEMRKRFEQSLPKLPKEATPEQIDHNQRTLQKLVQDARATAKPGDIFTPEAQPVIKRLLASVFEGADGKQLRASIVDDEDAVTVARLKPTVNSRYPDDMPLSAVPAQILQTLPKLTEELEYRFIGDTLILLDVGAHVIADFIDDAIPK